ncbi:hypothetical protein LIER_28531 [Lithospermum erythrorhizon]|uniref:Reverse transcriptase domain-containing protein n=1 Tax=Lithospermum erythrorhizon TaxID=34254 RepID=A0AAV3RJL5_LITER
MKGNDPVKWEFLGCIMERMGFRVVFVHWVKACVTSPHFTVNINGLMNGEFSSQRGLRQGDPISPFFSCWLWRGKYHPDCKELSIINIMFADDMFILSTTEKGSLMAFEEGLGKFGEFSGLKPNIKKSNMFVVGVLVNDPKALSELMGIPLDTLPIKYLGFLLPLRELLHKIVELWWRKLHLES